MAMYKGYTKAQGAYQSKMTCKKSNCRLPFFVNPHFKAADGRWNCPYCGTENP